MSLILDALRRAERERRAEHAPVLEPMPAPAAASAPAWRRPARIAGLAALVLVLLGAGWTLLRKPAPDAPSETNPSEAALEPAPPNVAPAPAPALPEPLPEAEPEVIPGTESVASLEELTEGVVEEVPSPPPAPTPRSGGSIATQPQAPASTAQPVEAPAVEELPPREIPPALTQPAPMRKLREMPPDYRADFPALVVEVHVFERVPAQRFVRVNGRRYREGEQMAEGPRVIEIVRDGMVLEFRGEKVLYTLAR